jgi:hypothetical protein
MAAIGSVSEKFVNGTFGFMTTESVSGKDGTFGGGGGREVERGRWRMESILRNPILLQPIHIIIIIISITA